VAPILLEGGRPSPLELRRLTLAGQAEYDAVHRFLELLARAPRRTDPEAVRLVAAPRGGVTYTIQLGLPVYTGDPAPSPPSVPRVSTAGARTPEEGRILAREAVLRAHLAELVERAARARVFAALSRPVGAALVDGAWQAYAYGPGRVLWTLAPGARFFDGEVKSVTSTAVTFDVAGKPVELELP
jgi:hypothetical protein